MGADGREPYAPFAAILPRPDPAVPVLARSAKRRLNVRININTINNVDKGNLGRSCLRPARVRSAGWSNASRSAGLPSSPSPPSNAGCAARAGRGSRSRLQSLPWRVWTCATGGWMPASKASIECAGGDASAFPDRCGRGGPCCGGVRRCPNARAGRWRGGPNLRLRGWFSGPLDSLGACGGSFARRSFIGMLLAAHAFAAVSGAEPRGNFSCRYYLSC